VDRFTKMDKETKMNRLCDGYINIYFMPYNRNNNAVENQFACKIPPIIICRTTGIITLSYVMDFNYTKNMSP
jgi:hypothetical protein